MSLLKVNNVTDLGDDAVITDGALVGAGKILQVVSTTKTDTFSTSSSSFTDVTGLSVSITPSSASNKIYVVAQVPGDLVSANSRISMVTVLRDSTNLANASSPGSRTACLGSWNNLLQTDMTTVTGSVLDSPATTSTLNYKVQVKSATAGDTTHVNRSGADTDAGNLPRGVSTITVMEVAG